MDTWPPKTPKSSKVSSLKVPKVLQVLQVLAGTDENIRDVQRNLFIDVGQPGFYCNLSSAHLIRSRDNADIASCAPEVVSTLRVLSEASKILEKTLRPIKQGTGFILPWEDLAGI